MKAGLLNENIVILTSKITTSEYGENINTWFAKYKSRANVKYLSQNRTTTNNEIFYSTTIEFKVRDYLEINEFDRIKWKGNQYRILSIIPYKEDRSKTIITELVNE